MLLDNIASILQTVRHMTAEDLLHTTNTTSTNAMKKDNSLDPLLYCVEDNEGHHIKNQIHCSNEGNTDIIHNNPFISSIETPSHQNAARTDEVSSAIVINAVTEGTNDVKNPLLPQSQIENSPIDWLEEWTVKQSKHVKLKSIPIREAMNDIHVAINDSKNLSKHCNTYSMLRQYCSIDGHKKYNVEGKLDEKEGDMEEDLSEVKSVKNSRETT